MTRPICRLGALLLLLSLLLTGCQTSPAAYEHSFSAMDTFMHLTIYGDRTSAEQVQEEILQLEKLLSVTEASGEVYAINHRTDSECTLSPELTALLEQALILARQTDGAFDPTVYPIVRQWGFTTDRFQVPTQEDLTRLLPLVDHNKVTLTGQSLRLEPEMMLDFGGIAKGWAGDRAAQLLRGQGVTSAILRLGGNIHTIGTKPNGARWNIGIEDPATGGMLGTVAVADQAVVTSGSYQRFFTENDQTYHHIIDPATGHPADNDLTSVTVVGSYGARCDALSTALFVMGLDSGAQFWREHRDFDAIFVSEDGSTAITAGLEGNFQLSAPGTRIVEVLK